MPTMKSKHVNIMRSTSTCSTGIATHCHLRHRMGANQARGSARGMRRLTRSDRGGAIIGRAASTVAT